jgi:drug/metabolite transporter (DMT)-like permease
VQLESGGIYSNILQYNFITPWYLQVNKQFIPEENMDRIIPAVQSRIKFFTTSLQTGNPLLPKMAIMGAVVLWGGSFVAMRVTVTAIGPMVVMWCRMMIALVLILPFWKSLFPATYRSGDWKLLVPMVLFQPCLYFLLESNALQFTTSSQAGVISATVPILVTLGAALFLSEAISLTTMTGIALSITGVIILTLVPSPQGSGQNPLLGNMLELLAMICAAGNMLIIKRLSERYNPWGLTAMQIVAGAIFFFPGAFLLHRIPLENVSLSLILSLVFLGGFATFGAFGLYNWGISQIKAAKASSFINLIPVVAVFSGWAILGESLSLLQCLAACAVIAGVILTQRNGS